jgi:hypothetical protein
VIAYVLKIIGAPDEWSGFSHGSAQISNCLYIGTAQQIGNFCHTIGYTYATCTNCYYLNACGSTLGDNAVAQGTQVTEEQLKNGHVAKLLQAGRTDKCFWAQQLGEMPSLFDASKDFVTNYVYWNPSEQQWYCYKFNSTGYLPIGLDFYAAQAQIDRSVTADKAYTVSLPFEWGNTQDKIYTLSSVDEAKGIASFREVTNYDTGDFENFKAYHPYLVIPKSNRDRLGPWSVFVKAEPETPVAENVNGVKWCATYTGMSNAEAAASGYLREGRKESDEEVAVIHLNICTDKKAKEHPIGFGCSFSYQINYGWSVHLPEYNT